MSAEIVLPDGASHDLADRSRLWNSAELAEKRKDACVGREYEVALPAELSADQRRELVRAFARALADAHGIAVDAAIHLPDTEGDQRNHHAHVLTTTRVAGPTGLGAKAAIEQAGRNRKADLESTRAVWEELVNQALANAGSAERIDRRSLVDQQTVALERGDQVGALELDRIPTVHMGPVATEIERKGRASNRGDAHRTRLARNAERAVLRAALVATEAEIRDEVAASQGSAAGGSHPSVLGSYLKPGPKRRADAASVRPVPSAPIPAIEPDDGDTVTRRSREAFRRYQAAGNSWGAGGGEIDAEAEVWHGRRVGWLERRYQDDDLGRRLAEVGVVVQWVSFPRAGDRCALLRMRVGDAVVTDDGRELSTDVADDQAIALMLACAQARGWKTITLSGSDEFIRKSMQAMEGTGIEVTAVNGKAVAVHGRPLPKRPGPRM